MSDTVLVTGATGFVGAAVARRLLDHGFRVRALVRPTSVRDNLAGLDVETVTGDLGDPASLERAATGCRGLFHVAADYRLWARHPSELYASNVCGTRHILLAARRAGITRAVVTSSVATLGLHADGSTADEDTPVALTDMIGHYKRSKFLAERVAQRLAARTGMQIVIVNPATPVGPRDIKPTPTGRLIVDAARGRMPAWVDTGLNVVHVDDVAQGHLLAWQHGGSGRRYLLGAENLGLREIITRVAALNGHGPPRVRLPPGPLLPLAYLAEGWARLSGRAPTLTVDGIRLARKHMYFSHLRAERELGYRPRPVQQALVDAVAWFREHGYVG